MKIIVAEKVSSAGLKVLKAEAGWMVISPEEFAAAPDEQLKDADALIVRSAIQADAAMLAKAPKLKVVGRAGVGVDNVDVEAATRQGIVVMNTPGANAIAVAEHTIGLMIALARHIPRATETTLAGKWEKKNLQGTELKGKTLGIVGLGRVGIETARRATAMGMTVAAYDPYVAPTVAAELNVSVLGLDELYAKADYLSLHLGLSAQTASMINADAIAKMKPGVRIVNCARGELIDEAALAEGLKSGKIAGVALDVFTVEPPKNNPLFQLPNVIATPHIGGSTAEAQDTVGAQIAQQVREYLKTGVAQNAVNVPTLSEKEYEQLQPYMDLAEKLGSLLAQQLTANLEELHIRYAGPVAEWKTPLLRSSAIRGVLQPHAQELINVVNATAQAESRGLRVSESHSKESAGPSIVSVTLKSAQGGLSAKGTVVHGTSPRIIELNGVEIETPLSGNLLLINNRDLPGVVGRVGSILGAANVNIARFALGRESRAAHIAANGTAPGDSKASSSTRQGTAIAIVETDTTVPANVLKDLRAQKEILSLATVSFA